jgi:hypothetical protein
MNAVTFLKVDPKTLSAALGLFSGTEEPGEFRLSEGFSVLHSHLVVYSSYPPEATLPVSPKKSAVLKCLFAYADSRFQGLFLRLGLIRKLRELYLAEHPEDLSWNSFAGLLITDFHVDLSSSVDAIAPVVVEATAGIKGKDKKKLPGFPDIQAATSRTYRTKLPETLRAEVDLTDAWWPAVKRVRDLLVHRQHLKIVFGSPSDGVLFQVFERSQPVITDPALLVENATDVADFEEYSAVVFAHLLWFRHNLALRMAEHLGVTLDFERLEQRGGYHGLPFVIERVLRKLST